MELVLRLDDESKLSALLTVLRGFTASEGVELAVESLERRAILNAQPAGFDWSKWDDLMSRDKRRPGQPELLPQEEEEWIAEQIMEMRRAERAQQSVQSGAQQGL